jgi:hypothetical protein
MKHQFFRRSLLAALALAVMTWAAVAQADTAKLVASVTGRGSITPNDNGRPLVVGNSYTVHAVHGPGCVFTNWTVTGTTNVSSLTETKLTFTMTTNTEITANFLDVQAPTVTITTKKETVTNAVILVSGTAKDNVGVVAVWWQVGSSGWNLAASDNGFTNWQAPVLLTSGADSFQAYAEDAAGNKSPTNTVALTDDATGFAPETFAGTTLQLVTTNANATLSFGDSSFSQAGSNVTIGVGLYDFSRIDANTVQLNSYFTSPPDALSNNEVFTLTFTNGASGTWTNIDTNSGTFTIGEASSTAPDAIYGLTIQGSNTTGIAYSFTNLYGDGTLTVIDNSGTSAGYFAYSKHSPTTGLIYNVITNGPDDSSTNYIVVDFSESNTYYALVLLTNGQSTNIGTLTAGGETTNAGYIAPEVIAGTSAAISEVKGNGKRRSFTISFSRATYSDFSTDTNNGSAVGLYNYIRTGKKTAIFSDTPVFPPDQTNKDTTLVSFDFTSPHAANFTNEDGSRGTITLAVPAAATAPISLAGRKFTGAPGPKSGGFAFANGTFTGVGHSSGETGAYTYAVYGPRSAMAVLTFTDTADVGTKDYLIFWFATATSGSYSEDNGLGDIVSGTFTMK